MEGFLYFETLVYRVHNILTTVVTTIESFRFEYENEYEYEFTSVLTLRMRSSP